MDNFNTSFKTKNEFDNDADATATAVATDQNTDADKPEEWVDTPVSDALDVVISNAVVTPQPGTARPMQKRRFFTGMLVAGGGIGLMLCNAVGALHSAGANGNLSLPAVALCMIVGLMLLGGGFGVMATAAPRFDDNEFDRLLQQGTAPLPLTASSPEPDETIAEQSDAQENSGRSDS